MLFYIFSSLTLLISNLLILKFLKFKEYDEYKVIIYGLEVFMYILWIVVPI